jgi:hypothetical protein
MLSKARDSTHFWQNWPKLGQRKSSHFFGAKVRDISRFLVKKWPKLWALESRIKKNGIRMINFEFGSTKIFFRIQIRILRATLQCKIIPKSAIQSSRVSWNPVLRSRSRTRFSSRSQSRINLMSICNTRVNIQREKRWNGPTDHAFFSLSSV